MWVSKKALEEDIKEAVEDGDRDNPRYHELVEQHVNLNRSMFTVLHASRNGNEEQVTSRMSSDNKPPQSSLTNASFKENEAPFVIYFEYKEDEMPTVVWIHMPVDMLYDAAITMLQQRGETVFPSQIKL